MFKKRDMAPDAKLTGLDYLGYFFGAGTNILNLIVSAFLLIYYSNVLYLGLTEVGTVMAVSKVFDGVSDLIMGRIIDKTKSKYGKARPWYARMIIPTTVCVLLLFWMPAGFKGMMQYVYVFVTYNLVSTVCYFLKRKSQQEESVLRNAIGRQSRKKTQHQENSVLEFRN